VHRSSRIPPGIWIIIIFHILNLILWTFGQTIAVFNYDLVASWGLQDQRILIDPATVEMNRGIGAADTIILLPIFLIAIIGLLKQRLFGAIASWMAFALTLYWPVVFWFSQMFFADAGIKHQPLSVAVVILPAVFMVFALWGTWYLTKHWRDFR
jgi:hypothetical protein